MSNHFTESVVEEGAKMNPSKAPTEERVQYQTEGDRTRIEYRFEAETGAKRATTEAAR